jgi:phosphate uptake regulator/protein-tyrosine-phosphatase
MTLYEQRLANDRARIRRRLQSLGDAVRRALSDSVHSVLSLDPDLAADTVLGDLPINRQAQEVDHLCHLFVARHLPSAGHLRFITGVLRLSKTMERIGDYAATISREVHQIGSKVPSKAAHDIETLAQKADQILNQALQAFLDGDVHLARATRADAASFGYTYDQVFHNLAETGEKGKISIPGLFALLTVCNRLERVIHQGKNIAEQAIFVATGEQKQNKTFDILFLGLRNDGASLLAEHYCRRAYSEVGKFSSAGWDSVDTLPPELIAFAEQKGLSLEDTESVSFSLVKGELSEFDIVIDLTGEARDHIHRIPFHTTLLVWNLDRSEGYQGIFQDLENRLARLMVILRGKDAAG